MGPLQRPPFPPPTKAAEAGAALRRVLDIKEGLKGVIRHRERTSQRAGGGFERAAAVTAASKMDPPTLDARMPTPIRIPRDENEAASKQSILRSSGDRTPLRDLACQAAAPKPKTSSTRCSVSGTPMLTQLLKTRMSTQLAPASGTATPINIWADPQPDNIPGTWGRRLPFTSSVCKTDLQNVIPRPSLPSEIVGAHLPSDVLEASFEEASLEVCHHGSDVESTGIYPDFTRSTPKGHSVVEQKDLNIPESPVPGSDTPGKLMSYLQSRDLLGQRAVTRLCPDEEAAGMSVEGQDMITSCGSLLQSDSYVVASAGSAEAVTIGTHKQHSGAILPTACKDSLLISSLASVLCEELAHKPGPPIASKLPALEAEKEVTADREGAGESKVAPSHRCRGTVEGGMETLPMPLLLIETMPSAGQLGAGLEGTLHDSEGMAVGALLTVWEEAVCPMGAMSVEVERPLSSGEKVDALPVDHPAREVGALPCSVVQRTVPSSGSGHCEIVTLSGIGEAEDPLTLGSTRGTDSATVLKDNMLPLTDAREQVGPALSSSSEVGLVPFSSGEGGALPLSSPQGTLSSSRVDGGLVHLNESGEPEGVAPQADCERAQARSLPRSGAGEDGALGLVKVGEQNTCSREEHVQPLPDGTIQSCALRMGTSHLDPFPKIGPCCEVGLPNAVEPELQIALTAAGAAPMLGLLGLGANAGLGQFVSEEGERHSDLPQAKSDGRAFLQCKAWTSRGLQTAGSTAECTLEASLDCSAAVEEAVDHASSWRNFLPVSCHIPGEAEAASSDMSSQTVSSSLAPGSFAVTCMSPVTSLEQSVDSVSTLAGMMQGVPLPMSQEEFGTDRTPVSTATAVTWVTPLALLERSMNTSGTVDLFRQGIPSPVSQEEAGTHMTPICSASAVTWMTPIMLMERSMNTSTDTSILAAARQPCTQDNAVGTDSLLWNFSREHLSSVPREELENRLENTLIVIEVLSRQLLEWQQNRDLARPSAQRESGTQTVVTHTSADQQHYYNLYVRAVGRVQALQRSQSVDAQLKAGLQKASSVLRVQQVENASIFASVETFYQNSKKDRDDMSQQVSEMRGIIADHETLLKRMGAKTRDGLQQRDEMKLQMEKALNAQEAADGCLADLEAHSSSVIRQLRRDLDSEKQLAAALKEAREQQLRFQKEVEDCTQSSCMLCQNMKADWVMMQAECAESQELLGQHRCLMDQMMKRVQTTLQEKAAMKCDMDQAVLEKQKVCSQLADTTSELCDLTTKNEQLHLENTRRGAGLTSLMETLFLLDSERCTLKEALSEQTLHLAGREESLVFQQSALEEKATRIQELEKENCQMSNVVLRQEQVLSQTQREKEALQARVQDLEEQQTYQQADLSHCQKRLQQMAELKIQLTTFTESVEFMEQENTMAREENDAYSLQLKEMESQLKLNLAALRERSFQCELIKDEVTQLRKERDNIQEELDTTKADASDMVLKMGEEMSDSSIEVAQAKEKLLCLMETLKSALQGEDAGVTGQEGVRTPADHFLRTLGRSFFSTVRKVKQATEDPGEGNASLLRNGTSAFTKVQPTTSKPAEVELSLTGSLAELQNIITDLVTTTARLCRAKKEDICQLKTELAEQKADCQSLHSRYSSAVSDLQNEVESLKTQNRQQSEVLSTRQQNMNLLQGMVEQQEKRVLELLSERKDVENLYSEISQLKRSVQLLETEAAVLHKELSSNSEDSARDWVQEKILLQQEITKLRLLLIDTANSKSEVVQKAMQHRHILERNLHCSEQEVKKLDCIIEKIRETLLSIPDVVASSEELHNLIEYLR